MTVKETLSGWGNFEPRQCCAHYLSSPTALQDWIGRSQDTYIARGFGRSYGDPSLNSGSNVLHQSPRNHFMAFDESTGLLTCEAGVSLGEIIAAFLPRGWFLPTTPGTKFVSVGGAIAADVHGKNHHVDGSWGAFVHLLDLLLSTNEVLTCSRTQNESLFRATLGGMGLTGIILQATIQLKKVQSAWVKVDYKRTRDLNDTFAAFAQHAHNYRHTVAWMDCVSKGAGMGRCVCMFGNDADIAEIPSAFRSAPLALPSKLEKMVPLDFPSWILNPLSVKAFNRLYYGVHGDSTKIVDYNSFFYPLDSVHHWNRIYGKRGFIQYQAFLPPETAEKGYEKILERITQAGCASFLAVFKSCGPGREGILSFLDEGYTLALDLPNIGHPLHRLTRELDAILIDNGGRLYLAKDALTTRENFAAMYPRKAEFMAVKNAFDPNGKLVSDQARRLGLVEGA